MTIRTLIALSLLTLACGDPETDNSALTTERGTATSNASTESSGVSTTSGATGSPGSSATGDTGETSETSGTSGSTGSGSTADPPTCGNMQLDEGEFCDPPESCPTSCDSEDLCTPSRLVGAAEDCTARCEQAPVTACAHNDGCCVEGCNANEDNDCDAVCGNGVVEGVERCDPCPERCDDGDACTLNTSVGDAAQCTLSCSFREVTLCQHGDGCCPSGCTGVDDDDCEAVCGNSVVEGDETCDPPESCPSSCDVGAACSVATLEGDANSCSARCVSTPISACADGDGCCPSGCDRGSDGDCDNVCGDGVREGQETCDPPESCPSSCDDGNVCTDDLLVGSAETCDLRCTFPPRLECIDGDGCCPSGCDSTEDNDCQPRCGNNVVEAGETCDPPGSCPITCDDNNACTLNALTGSASSCNASCVTTAVEVCQNGDGCCPSGCDSNRDSDCTSSCGNEVVEEGETCDPPGSCPTTCDDNNACTVNTLTGSAASCTARCETTPRDACQDGDGCCPAGCDSNRDSDCSSSCGNETLEEGESCDPPGSCPTNCSDGDVCTRDTLTGSAETCSAVCSYEEILRCTDGDGCCPDGCDNNSDSDCAVVCGNGRLEAGETCDPPESCPTSCDDNNSCTSDQIVGDPSACTASCQNLLMEQCVSGDMCCPDGCTSETDGDCVARCGDGVVNDGETCDPPGSCPLICTDSDSCTTDRRVGDAETCDVSCEFEPIVVCVDDDGCCPDGCESRDSDCQPAVCNNGVVESGETCDPRNTCPRDCNDNNACTIDELIGRRRNCDAECVYTAIETCINGDGCCPTSCNRATDSDCSSICGDDVVDFPETCDPPESCPTSCNDNNACTTDRLVGAASSCSAECVFDDVTTCSSGDGCCPDGCNNRNDSDCPVICGNGVVEAGETCDPPESCQTSCTDGDSCTADTLQGSAERCNVVCSYSDVTSCVDGDGCCVEGCDDADCGSICGNNELDPGETCDPPSSCPTSCNDNDSCTSDRLVGDASSCTAECVSTAIGVCVDGDGCCPGGCTLAEDSDCAIDCTNSATWPPEWTAFEDEVVRLTNIARSQGAFCGDTFYPAQGPLDHNPLLRIAARCHTLDMAVNDFVDHSGSDGNFMDVRVDATGYNWRALGENVAGGQTTPAIVVDAWMNSPGHCTNIMSSSFLEMGAGYVFNGDGRYRHYWTQVFGASF